ncbi:MAG: YraN family protein [Bacteroidaceae bacterium]|nr:YraN family protein [Bacteroidaceae bacterium]
MAEHNLRGKRGEEEAAKHLLTNGYTILHRNWRSGHKELDIVARQGNELVVVEVKSRKDTLFGQPEDAVDGRKIRRIVASTDAYLRKFAIDLPVRFDIITVIGEEAPYRIEHICDAFFPPMWN